MKNPKKIFFFGTPEIAVPSLEFFEESQNFEIIGVGVFPDKPVGRKKVLKKCPVKIFAESKNLPIFEITQKSDLIEIYKNEDFDFGVVIAFGMIFPAEILKDGKFLNVHFSLLPELRGASPVQSAILDGKKFSGITIQKMKFELDAGDIYFQKEFPINGKKTSELWEWFANETAKIFSAEDILEKTPVPQNNADATFCGKFEKSDGEINFKKMTAKEIYQKFLAFDVWPGIFFESKFGKIKLTEIFLDAEKITEVQKTVEMVATDGGKIFVARAQVAGKKEMLASEILNGNPEIFKI
jgi:methionyl-tRNA formyltransferase